MRISVLLKFRRSKWTFLFSPVESSMVTATALNPLTAIFGACTISAESAFAKRERDQVASFYKAEMPMKDDPWEGLVGRVKKLNGSFNAHMAAYWRQGDMTARWRVAHVGKTGLLGAILALPETDDNMIAATRLKRMALGEEMKRKHGDEFNYYPQILELSATSCPYSRLQAVRWHRLITGAQYSGSALIEKIRLQSAVPTENTEKMGWDATTGAESLTEVSRAFRFLVLRAIERKCTAAAITQASKRAKKVGEEDVTDDESIVQGAELMDQEAESHLARLAPAADERPYPAQFSSDMTTPFSARAGITIPRLPYVVEDGMGGPVAPLPASSRIEETVKTDALDLIQTDKPGIDLASFWAYRLKPVSAVSDGHSASDRKRSLELSAYVDTALRPKKCYRHPVAMAGPSPQALQSYKTLAVAAGKDEAAKPMGYSEQYLMSDCHYSSLPPGEQDTWNEGSDDFIFDIEVFARFRVPCSVLGPQTSWNHFPCSIRDDQSSSLGFKVANSVLVKLAPLGASVMMGSIDSWLVLGR